MQRTKTWKNKYLVALHYYISISTEYKYILF